MRLKVTICDDDREYAEYVDRKIREILPDIAESTIYNSGDELLAKFDFGNTNILITDICIGEKNGIDIATQIKEKDHEVDIIIMTNYDDLVYDSFKCQPIGFIRKNRFEADMKLIAARLMSKYNREFACMEVTAGLMSRKIMYRDIYMVEVVNHDLHIFLENETITIRKTLKSIEPDLEKSGFLKVRNSIAVNKNYIASIIGDEVTMKNHKKVYASRGFLGKLKKEKLQFTS